VRAARTTRDAVGAIANAMAQVRKTIVLLKVDDPTSRKTRDGELVVETLQVAGDKLQRAVGL
jgi:ssDNA-binding replication factor A large subunit